MRPGTISRIINYYERSPEYDHDIERAATDFFGRPPNKLSAKELTEETEHLFFDWFIFDYTLPSGRTPLMEYEFKNPDQLSELELRETLELGDSHYGLFEVTAVRKGLGMDLRDPFTGSPIAVVERLGTYGMEKGDLICARICKLGGRYEFVGGLLNKLPVRLSDSVRQAWREQKSFITTPKDVWKMWCAPRPKNKKLTPNYRPEFVGDLNEARENLSKALARNKLDIMVTAETVEEWIAKRTPKGKELAPLTMLAGLLPEQPKQPDVELLLKAYHALYSVAPHNALGEISPREKARRSKHPFGSKGLTLHETKIPPEGGFGKIEEAHEAMQAADPAKAAALFNQAFALYQKTNTTFREVYRFYANAATAYFAGGDVRGGLTLLNIALKLNPNYDFALDLKKRYEKGELDALIMQGWLGLSGGKKRLRREFAIAAALRYYEFLKEWKINFATKEKTDSVRTYWSSTPGQPIGRNEPCPCGAKTDNGQLIKFKRCHGKNE